MKTSKFKWILGLFILVMIGNLLGQLLGNPSLMSITKPLLMPLLGVYFCLETQAHKCLFRTLLLVSLLFAWGGDVFLMFSYPAAPNEVLFFILGLGSFLLAHVFYSIAFRTFEYSKVGFVRRNPWILLPLSAYYIGFLSFLWGQLPEDLLIPVVVYSTAIVVMALFAFNLISKIGRVAAQLLIAGVLLFIFSDSCIALTRFTSVVLPNAGFCIMSMYSLGQLLIVLGAVRMLEEDKTLA